MKDLNHFGINLGQGKYHEEAIYTIALVYNMVSNRIANYLRDFDMTIGKLNILLVIKTRGLEQGISQVDISKHLIVTPSNMTKMLDKLEKEALVARGSDSRDRRVKTIKITKKGLDVLSRLWDGYNDCLKEAVGCLDNKEQKEVARLLKKWFHGLE